MSCVTFLLLRGLTSVYKGAYSTAAIFNTSSLNASAVASDISIFSVSLTLILSHACTAIKQPTTACTHIIRSSLSQVDTPLTGSSPSAWQGTRWLSLGHYHLKPKDSCCQQNLFSGIYNFLCLQVEVCHHISFFIFRKKQMKREEICQSCKLEV